MTETIDAPEPIEPEVVENSADVVTDTAEVVEEEQKSEELSDSSPDEEAKLTQADVDKIAAKLTKKRRAAERDAEYWREQAMQNKPEPKPEPVEEVKTLSDFGYDEGAYQQHLFTKARAEAVEEAKRVLQEEQSQQSTNKRLSEFRSREADFSKDAEDYHEVVTNPDLSINQTMADVAMEMDNGPEVLYYLGKNPALADEISRLPALSAARELGRIEAKILNKPATEKVSKAPAPTPKLTAVESTIKKAPEDMTQKEFNNWRRKQIANRGR